MDLYISNYTSDEDMVPVRRRWMELLPRVYFVRHVAELNVANKTIIGGGGDVHLENPEGPYLLHPIFPGEKFTVTWTHQLHCLVSTLHLSLLMYAELCLTLKSFT